MDSKVPFYYSNWFITVLVIAWPAFGIPLVLAILLMLLKSRNFMTISNKEYQAYTDEYENLEKIKEEASLEMRRIDNVRNEADRKIKLYKKETESHLLKEKTRIEADLNFKKDEIQNDIKRLEKTKKDVEFFVNDNIDKYISNAVFVDFDDTISSDEIKNKIAMHKLKEKDAVKTELTKKLYNDREINNQTKQILRSFNTEADFYISNVNAKNIDTYRTKLMRSYEALNKLFEIDGVKIDRNYLNLKLEHLSLVYQYQVKIENEKELLKAQKEEIREQQRVEKELEDQRKKLEKEETQFNNELTKMLGYMSQATSDIDKGIYADKIKELETRIKQLESDKKDVENRQSNTRAGFVYIISNIGSFGQDVYKIGMTRRLEPLDRINELGSASVPFKFDVHAIIFSEDAPKLESILHQHFRAKEVNKINPRKEFFKVDLDEIKAIVNDNYDKTVTFYDEPEALEYRESLKISND